MLNFDFTYLIMILQNSNLYTLIFTSMLAIISFFAGGLLMFLFKNETKIVFEDIKSELSDPKVNIPPYWFYADHYRILESIAYYSWFWNPEFTYHHIKLWDKSWDKRASELAKMGFLNVRSERLPIGKRNYYSINKKGRQAILNFSNRF